MSFTRWFCGNQQPHSVHISVKAKQGRDLCSLFNDMTTNQGDEGSSDACEHKLEDVSPKTHVHLPLQLQLYMTTFSHWLMRTRMRMSALLFLNIGLIFNKKIRKEWFEKMQAPENMQAFATGSKLTPLCIGCSLTLCKGKISICWRYKVGLWLLLPHWFEQLRWWTVLSQSQIARDFWIIWLTT